MSIDETNLTVEDAEFEIEQLTAISAHNDVTIASCGGCRGCKASD